MLKKKLNKNENGKLQNIEQNDFSKKEFNVIDMTNKQTKQMLTKIILFKHI